MVSKHHIMLPMSYSSSGTYCFYNNGIGGEGGGGGGIRRGVCGPRGCGVGGEGGGGREGLGG